MRFHTFGNKENSAIVLIHGMLTPWQIFQPMIDAFSKLHYIIVPALDGHVEEEASEYISYMEEAKQIEDYVLEHVGKQVFAGCGLSMGGVIANHIFENRNLQIQHLVIDGGPLLPINRMLKTVMTKQYLSIIHKSKERDAKVLESFKRDFLPECYLESFLRFADTMSDDTIVNMVDSVCASTLQPSGNAQVTDILFMHGTKGNEAISKQAAKKMQAYYPHTQIKCFQGYQHAQLLVYEPNTWIETVQDFWQEE